MPNLVGIGNSQVPTNAMLGGLAYENSSVLDEVRAGRKNMIINGDMRINQRYGTSSSTVKDTVTIDRWRESNPGASGMSHQTVTDSPDGFEFSEKMTMGGSNYSVTSSQSFYFAQVIEAHTAKQLQLGQSTAKNFTVSFWVKSSVAGQFSIAAGNTTSGGYTEGNTNRTFVSSYQINDTGTWEYKTVTFPGDTSGTWQRSSTLGGLSIIFDMGSGSQHESTPGQWVGNDNFRMPGSKRLSAANSYWQITGVQCEEGNVATAFEYRSLSDELKLCQRYYAILHPCTQAQIYIESGGTNTHSFWEGPIPAGMRSEPTVNLLGTWTGHSMAGGKSISAVSVQGVDNGGNAGTAHPGSMGAVSLRVTRNSGGTYSDRDVVHHDGWGNGNAWIGYDAEIS